MKPLRLPLWTLLSPSLAAYLWLGYVAERADFTVVLSLFAVLFALYGVAMRAIQTLHDEKLALGAAILFRVALLFSLPNLSDDFYRFIWDGRLLLHGENPFAKQPSAYSQEELAMLGLSEDLFSKLNSPNYFSVYPALCQLGFWLGAAISPSSVLLSVVVMKLYLLLFECGTLFLLPKLCTALGVDKKNALYYGLNPLVIIEIGGNLHFEAVMIFFLVLTLYLFRSGEDKRTSMIWGGALSLALSASAKLLSLIFLPVFVRRLGWTRGTTFAMLTVLYAAVLLLLLVPVTSGANFFSSIRLYFQTFEFNASFYALARWAAANLIGGDAASTAGAWLGACTMIAIVGIAFFHNPKTLRSSAEAMLFSLATYFFFATTIHPWYLATLVALSVVSSYRFALVWSGMATLSYSAYQSVPYQEQAILIFIEYALVFGTLVVERRMRARSEK
ncbi:MAG: hypothetical protein SNJ55_03830 [Chloroherpetonaceae bacterium]